MSKGARLNKRPKAHIPPSNFPELIEQLRSLVHERCTPLPEEPDFGTRDDILKRFLQARKFVVKDAFKQLSSSIEWRRSFRPLHHDCSWCRNTPGYHSIRQVGFDINRQPVLYACFSQSQTLKNTAEDCIAHVVYLVENALKCCDEGKKIIIVLDCTGLTLPCCNPKIGRSFTTVFGNNYPETLSKFLMVHHTHFLQNIWRTIKVFLDPVTADKVKLVKKEKIEQTFREYFDQETITWLLEELEMNKPPISETQLRFWEDPRASGARGRHDPRGVPSYVRDYVEPLAQRKAQYPRQNLDENTLGLSVHLPHPNIVQCINGNLSEVNIFDPTARGNQPTTQEMEQYGVITNSFENLSDED
ncbi:unnamed protein product [Calicophoron daubneyi]|uniref:CRAL-TRIO domain-containing protein n=1 Tax=Calicophoron daubneyi TaxID=300641 RepID=A0AAV2TIA5_CALDB